MVYKIHSFLATKQAAHGVSPFPSYLILIVNHSMCVISEDMTIYQPLWFGAILICCLEKETRIAVPNFTPTLC